MAEDKELERAKELDAAAIKLAEAIEEITSKGSSTARLLANLRNENEGLREDIEKLRKKVTDLEAAVIETRHNSRQIAARAIRELAEDWHPMRLHDRLIALAEALEAESSPELDANLLWAKTLVSCPVGR